MMTQKVFCKKLDEELEGLEQPPYPGELGQKIYENISSSAWEMWVQHQTMLINEYQLNLMKPDAREFLAKEMEKFLFGAGSEKPTGFIEPEENEK